MRRRARFSRLLPALALLLGALGLFAAAPAQAQSFWSATLTVATVPDGVGCSASQGSTPCSSQLTDDAFTIGGTEISFSRIRDFHDANQDRLEISFDQQIQSPPSDLKFCVGATAYDFPDTAFREHPWTADVGWSAGGTVSLSIATSCSQPPAAPTGLTARAGDGTLDLAWTAPSGTVTGYDVHYTTSTTVNLDADLATDSDPATGWVDAGHTGTTASRSITGLTNALQHRLRVRAANAAGSSGWLSGYGEPRRAMWTVTLSAAPNPVAEGASVTVTATVSQPITGGAVARIPLTVTDGTAEPGDRGTATEIRIRRNETTGSASISTAHDADSDDETFTVAIDTDNLAPALAAGSPGSVEITIRDDEGSSPLPTMDSQVCPASGRVWSATMTAGEVTTNNAERFLGYLRSHPFLSDTGALTRSRFAYRNAAFYGIERIFRIVSTESDTNGSLTVYLDKALTDGVAATLALHAGGKVFRFAEATQPADKRALTWSAAGLDWMANEQVGLCLTDTVVTLSYNDPVYEGQELRLTATVPHPLTDAVTIPVYIADSQTGQGTTLDDGFAGIMIPADSASGTATILMPHDEDTVDESYRVGLGTREFEDNRVRYGELPALLVAGNPTSLHVTVYDDDEPVLPAEATLRALRNPVAEGLRAQVRLALSHALDEDATIPVTVTRGTSEDGDHGTLENIEVPAGEVYGYAHISTAKDADTEDETFTVALDAANLPDGVTLGDPASVEVTIADDGEAREPPAGTPTVSLYAHPNPVAEGTTVRVRARLSSLLADDVTIPLVVTRDTSEASDHGTLGSITIPFGFLEAIGEITTEVDTDTDDETFTVALDTANLPAGVTAAGEGSVFGGPSATVTIADGGASGQSVQGSSVSAQTDRPPVAVHRYAALIAQMYEWRNDPQWRMYRAHTARWDRALLAFGETVSDASLTPMTAAEAQAFADRGWTRWVEVAEALRQIESGGVRAAAPPTPVVTIAAGEEAVTESALVVFTVTAAPAPTADLGVTVTVGQEGAFVYDWGLGAYTVTIPAGETSETFEVLTEDDEADEPDGAVVATLASGAGYALGTARRARVAVADDDEPVPAVVTKRAIAREGSDEAVVFTVRLDRAAPETVTVDYATADGAGSWARVPPATAGADYTATSGTLAFAPGETWKSVSVPILDDAIDEGTEYFLLRFSNPQGAVLAAGERETQGLIRNDDHLQAMWLARFARTAGGQVTDAVSERLQGGLSPGAHATLAGQRVDLSKADDGKALAETLTGLARTFGAPSGPANEDDPFARHGLADPWNDSATATAARSITGRELLLGSGFHVAGTGEGSGMALAAWGRVAHASFDGEHADDTGRTNVDGEVMTGVLGADADFGRLLAGVAVSLSEADGGFDNAGADVGGKGGIESTMTTVSPYARFRVTERVTAWGLAGWGTGDMTIRFDDGSMAPVRTDLSMQLGAIGARGALMKQDDAGGMDLALKADAFFVRTESEKAVNSVETDADASRLRLVLEGGRSFALGGGATVRPALELGVRHDGGDAETGTGMELGGGVAFTDTASGLSIEARARMLVAHADSDYEEWGASATARLDPGARGRGLSFSLSPAVGASSSAAERMWGAQDARSLAPGAEFEASRGLQGEMGYGMALGGDRFTGTPNLGFGMSDGGARDWRIGWRLTSAVEGDPGFEVSLDATRREAGGGNAGHGVMLQGALRW